LLREKLQASLKDACEGGDERAAATLRLVLTALKERAAGSRESGGPEDIPDEDIVALLRDMVEQRQAEIGRCETHAHLDLAEREAEEMRILERFLPPRMDQQQIAMAVDDAIQQLGATRLKDAGRVIAALKERFNGQMDFGKAKQLLCNRLS
jgi:uncharacterized protein YqeY